MEHHAIGIQPEGHVLTMALRSTLRRILAFLALMIAATMLSPLPASAELRIDITRGKVEPMPIAISDFTGAEANGTRFGEDIAEVVSADLERSGLFRPIDKKSFIQKGLPSNAMPRFGAWPVINAQALIHRGV